jgi:hypothetical protein
MAHFALIDEYGIVRAVHVINNSDIDGGVFPESEPLGQQLQADLGIEGLWLQCSYSSSFRGTYPGLGYTWDGTVFAAPIIEETL